MEFTPHAYQKNCIERILNNSAVGLFLDMGLGKTVITLTALEQLKYDRFQMHKTLIIAPKKVAEATWQDEQRKWGHLSRLRLVTVLGTEAKRKQALESRGDVYIINRENVAWLVQTLGRRWDFDTVVLDESSSFKSHQSQRFKALKAIRPRINRMIELTGTPSPNGMMDLWAQVFLLDRGERLGRTISAYRDEFFRANTHGGYFTTYELRKGADQEIMSRLTDICVSMKAEDYLSLPQIIYDTVPVVLDDKARKIYTEMEQEAVLAFGNAEVTAANAAALSNKLLQLCNGAVYAEETTEDARARQTIHVHDCKMEALKELIEQLGDQHAIICYGYNSDRDRLVEELPKLKKSVRVYRGNQDADDWNAGKIDLLLVHPASCGYGLNLQQGGHHLVWFALTYNLEHYLQTNKRLHRQGQQQPVVVHHLVVKDGRDEDVMAAIERKDNAQEALLDSLKARIQAVRERGGEKE